MSVRLNLAPALPLVLASVAELNQVWANLLDNALDAVGPFRVRLPVAPRLELPSNSGFDPSGVQSANR